MKSVNLFEHFNTSHTPQLNLDNTNITDEFKKIKTDKLYDDIIDKQKINDKYNIGEESKEWVNLYNDNIINYIYKKEYTKKVDYDIKKINNKIKKSKNINLTKKKIIQKLKNNISKKDNIIFKLIIIFIFLILFLILIIFLRLFFINHYLIILSIFTISTLIGVYLLYTLYISK